jgi:serine/threonine-protein kinase
MAPGTLSTSAVRPPSSSTGPFATGSIIAGRYRLIALLGRGGMGEVYRAEDLTLDHPVALKFLPAGVASAGERLAQFHAELRLARQVSHKNVCRLYDLGDADGRRFLTMEYVDGEDLASLLRRIGRVPQDKAIEIARQLCAGLAAAHERGVLHRDLKPANVMIDGDGNVRLTDFGLAIAAADAVVERAGTPQYMAPEQLTGGAATVKTDLYALGLVLFEIFTGRRAVEAKTLPDLLHWHESGTLTTPTSVVRDLDPAIERLILRCLEKDPQRRPGSALAVAAALPGGDALAAALAAGETPSPDMLIKAAEREATPVRLAIALAAACVLGLAVYVTIAPSAGLAAWDPLEKPPAVLADRAEQILGALGYNGQDVDRASGFTFAGDYPRWIEQTQQTADRWAEVRLARPPAIVFWYRTSPRELVAARAVSGVSATDPPEIISSMRSVMLDTRGRLNEFHAVPPQVDAATPGPASAPTTWKPLFDAAALDISLFTPVAPEWTPSSFADERAAWDGFYAERPDTRIRVEAAAYRGRPVSFVIVGPWTRPARMTPVPKTRQQAFLTALNFVVYFSMLVAAALIARRNVRLNRADRRTAQRLAACLVVETAMAWAVLTHHTSTANVEAGQFFSALGYGLYLAATLWVLYLAIEPYARRIWPDGLFGWTRLFAGHVRDPRVGRDILIGCPVGVLLATIEAARIVLLPLAGQPMPRPILGSGAVMLQGAQYIVGMIQNWTYGPLQTSLICAVLFVAFRFVLRRDWAAFAACVLLLLLMGDNGQAIVGGIGLNTLFFALLYATMLVVLVKFGLLAITMALIVDAGLTSVPFPAHLSSWAGAAAMWTIVSVLALMAFGFYSARAGQPLFGDLSGER